MPKYPFGTTPICTQIRRKLLNETFLELFYVQLIYQQLQRYHNRVKMTKFYSANRKTLFEVNFNWFLLELIQVYGKIFCIKLTDVTFV